jgi:hypothetical protein
MKTINTDAVINDVLSLQIKLNGFNEAASRTMIECYCQLPCSMGGLGDEFDRIKEAFAMCQLHPELQCTS